MAEDLQHSFPRSRAMVSQKPKAEAGQARELLYAYGLLAPAIASVMFLIVYPLTRVVELSFREGRSMNFTKISELPLGFGNYIVVLTDPGFWSSIQATVFYVTGSVVFAFLIGLSTALLLNVNFPGRRYFRTLILLPWAVPGVVVSIIFLWMLDGSYGVVNSILRSLGLIDQDIAWFVNADTAMWAVIVPTVWKAYPLITLTLLAALQSIPRELYEASDIDGASNYQRFVFITWPGIRATAVLSAMISALWIFRDIDIIFAATHGGPARATETLALYTYNEAFQYFRMGVGSAVGTLMVTVALVGSVISVTMVQRDKF
ncbi:sugar ABC transporter permease [Rhizobium pusense]|uniref:carbohydrate ABC transporter permease n=1 Tax=Agrobacterium pusense TaxID=648995 RepID=UPI001C6E85AC|nr:sugar ABC transporter permease [Agrobacterium pusense]MBW9076365.1 sugar ABC transporter permease [Agrobacterium pusense]